jgi:predicted ester cyclase
MNRLVTLTVLAAIAVLAIAAPVRADNRTVVEAFYTEILSRPGRDDLGAMVATVLAPEWESIGDYSGAASTRGQFVQLIGGFGSLVPNLNWKIEEIVADGNRFVVRGRATGTPTATFFGVDPNGNSFDIMAIDIHTVENGLIVKTYHVEDWAGALGQLSAQ